MTTPRLFDQLAATVADDRVLVVTDSGELSYGNVRRRAVEAGGQIVLTPGNDLAGMAALLATPGDGRQVVVMARGLPPAEVERRATVARRAAHRPGVLVLFTSGSSGEAKAVRLTASNWLAAVHSSAAQLDHDRNDRWLAAMPLHHVGGLAILLRSAAVGGSVRWLPTFSTEAVVDALRGDVTIASLVPTMLRRVLDHDEGPFSDLKAVLVGGGPIPSGILEEARSRGIPAVPTYGMTETCAQVATSKVSAPIRHAVEPVHGIYIRLGVDDVIEVRGGQVSPGYADEDDRDPASWFVTSDVGRWVEPGLLSVLGRADDIIITGGENVHPARIEAVLAGHPEVRGVAVTGVADREWGQAVVAVIESTLDAPALRAWADERMAAHEVPKHVIVVDQIPMRTVGKPDRRRVHLLATEALADR